MCTFRRKVRQVVITLAPPALFCLKWELQKGACKNEYRRNKKIHRGAVNSAMTDGIQNERHNRAQECKTEQGDRKPRMLQHGLRASPEAWREQNEDCKDFKTPHGHQNAHQDFRSIGEPVKVLQSANLRKPWTDRADA